MSKENPPSLSELPLGDLVLMLEKFINNFSESEKSIPTEVRKQAAGFLKLLNSKLQSLSNGQRRGKSQEIRDKIIEIAHMLTKISGGISEEVTSESNIFSERSLSFLGNYGFTKCISVTGLEGYLDLDEHKIDKWNSIKFNAFLVHLSGISDYDAKKTVFLINFLTLDSIKSCAWICDNYMYLAHLIKKHRDKNEKAELKRLFNSLPGVQRDRRKGNIDDKNDPWNTLYYNSEMRGSQEAFGYTDSGLGRLPGKAGVVAAKGQPPK